MQVNYSHRFVRFVPLPSDLTTACKYLQFTHHTLEIPFKNESHTFDAWSRPLWAWILDHLVDPDIVRHIEWDAQKVLRHTERGSTRIYSEPWTGNRFWEIQVRLIIGPIYI